MPILNYTTGISTSKSAGEIQATLIKAKAQAVMTEYDAQGEATHIAFRITTPQGIVHYRLPANAEGVLKVLKRDKKVKRGHQNMEQARRVAWRIVKDWVEAQMAIIEAEIVSLEQVFLPYAQTSSGETVYERFLSGGLNMLENKAKHISTGEES